MISASDLDDWIAVDGLGLDPEIDYAEWCAMADDWELGRVDRDVLQEGTDYGSIPGTGDRKVLLKPGQESLCDLYRYRIETRATRTVGDGVTSPHVSWEVHAIVHLGDLDGPTMGDGHGSCNSF